MNASSKPKAYKPKFSSTLFNETGNVEIYRVSEETRRKVAEETHKIEEHRAQHNMRSRRQYQKQEHQKLHDHLTNYHGMVKRWEEKMSSSPYGVNQLEKEEKRRITTEEREAQQALDQWRSKLVLSMTGKAALGVAQAKEAKKTANNEQKLALALRQTRKDEATIKLEHKILDTMLLEEVMVVKRKFPNMPVPEHLFQEELQALDEQSSLIFPPSLMSGSQGTNSLIRHSQPPPSVTALMSLASQSRKSSPILRGHSSGHSSKGRNSIPRNDSSRASPESFNNDAQRSMATGRSDESDSQVSDYAPPQNRMHQLAEELGDMSLSDIC